MFKKNRFMVRIAALAVGAAMTAGLLGDVRERRQMKARQQEVRPPHSRIQRQRQRLRGKRLP